MVVQPSLTASSSVFRQLYLNALTCTARNTNDYAVCVARKYLLATWGQAALASGDVALGFVLVMVAKLAVVSHPCASFPAATTPIKLLYRQPPTASKMPNRSCVMLPHAVLLRS